MNRPYLESDGYTIILPVRPKFSIPIEGDVSISVLLDQNELQGFAPNILQFAPPITVDVLKVCADRAFVSLLFMPDFDFGGDFNLIALDFGANVKYRADALMLLDILDWD
ncbi:hypothetical protein NE237_020869 [Protea cynaroides]|uniref:Uncharacterized protein n=1 Tax=Protea cynaroides TaxID=273540 RepID=A0A9Q0H817_9MAGN|nr:hypothetical protein NE237_020869 [Protea cynaroides]